MQLALTMPITAMKCSGVLIPSMVMQVRSGMPIATSALENYIDCWKKFDQV